MRLLALITPVVCLLAANAQAQIGHQVVVSHQHQAGTQAGAYPYGCCEDDVSYAFDLWSNYCAERKPQGACLSQCRSPGGCNDHGGIFKNQPRRFRVHHCQQRAVCGDCEAQGCDQGCASAVETHLPAGDEQTEEEGGDHHQAEDTAFHYFGAPSQLTVEPEVVTQPVSSKNNASANRWYLPFNWKK